MREKTEKAHEETNEKEIRRGRKEIEDRKIKM